MKFVIFPVMGNADIIEHFQKLKEDSEVTGKELKRSSAFTSSMITSLTLFSLQVARSVRDDSLANLAGAVCRFTQLWSKCRPPEAPGAGLMGLAGSKEAEDFGADTEVTEVSEVFGFFTVLSNLAKRSLAIAK